MNISEISEKLQAAGCQIAVKGDKIFVNKTPNGSAGQYGYCVAGEDARDITAKITKRAGEIASIIRA